MQKYEGNIRLKKASAEVFRLQEICEKLSKDIDKNYSVFVGNSYPAKKVKEMIARISETDADVLILGKNGTGKELVAREIHRNSSRKDKVFINVDLGTVSESLFESELFGFTKSAFTDAHQDKPGRFELASGGTVFLDEIGDIPLVLQGKLLQVIEQKSFTRVGGRKIIEVDVRIIAATNAPIEKMVTEGRFRPDIFYRIKEYLIEMPPLRRRSEDIPLLVQHFLDLYGAKYGHPDLKISREALSVFVQYQWTGNVRELESVIQRIALDANEKSVLEALKSPENVKNTSRPVAETVRDTEVQAILGALSDTGWNRRKVAKRLGISYSSLRRRISKYHLTK